MVYNYSRLLYRDRADCQEERPAEAFMPDSLVLLVNWGSNPFPGAKTCLRVKWYEGNGGCASDSRLD